jgi:hypothetical protein
MTKKKNIAVHSTERNIGKIRRELYRNAFGYLKSSVKAKKWIEIIAISESIICDRLESLISKIEGKEREILTIGGNLQKLKKMENEEMVKPIKPLLDEIKNWGKKRNKVLHEMVKVRIGEENHSWKERLEYAKESALDGMKIARKISNMI